MGATIPGNEVDTAQHLIDNFKAAALQFCQRPTQENSVHLMAMMEIIQTYYYANVQDPAPYSAERDRP